MKPDLYCPKCKKFVEIIKERYRDPIIERRKWDGDTYELIDSNFSEVEYEQLCEKCNSHLELKENVCEGCGRPILEGQSVIEGEKRHSPVLKSRLL